ncbi:SAM-dependent methyltransferase [Nakamurella lactea]|uniref:SAM-dependent methyltransferase n=1 Tax=Nakamurella lactea TaxID=459515 RepID=UPI0003FA134C|nr:cyclopropane-fatty-acyl-phospholipid synthase family protein [Nakamurella lactea]
MGRSTVAERLDRVAATVLGQPLPLGITAWDGSTVIRPSPGCQGGAAVGEAPVIVVRDRRALRRMLWDRGELGLADAYICGEVDVVGDLGAALAALRPSGRSADRPPLRQWPMLLADGARLGAFGRRPEPPAEAASLTGKRHERARDRAAIAHHYDAGNEFYRLLLDDTMAYSCGYYPDGAGALADAQQAKLDLICRKLGLTAGSSLLDVGCGWGSLLLHAAQRFGVRATGLTLSRAQYEFVRDRITAAGLDETVKVVLADYRDLDSSLAADGSTKFDAVAAIEMGEHVGDREYPQFARLLHDQLRPAGTVLVQQMSRGADAPGGGRFIQTYIAPDMHMKPLAVTVGHLTGAGLEIRDVQALREHYPPTIDAWRANLEQRWDRAVQLAGEQFARIWRLYLAGSALAFADGRMGVDQIVAARPDRQPLDRAVVPAGRRTR